MACILRVLQQVVSNSTRIDDSDKGVVKLPHSECRAKAIVDTCIKLGHVGGQQHVALTRSRLLTTISEEDFMRPRNQGDDSSRLNTK